MPIQKFFLDYFFLKLAVLLMSIHGYSSVDAQTYLASLDGQIEGFSFKIVMEPESILPRLLLSQLLYEKAGYTGNPYDTAKAIAQLTKAIELSKFKKKTKKELGAIYLMRARQGMRLHKFKQVRSDLLKATDLGANVLQIKNVAMDLDWNTGEYDTALKFAREAAVSSPNNLSLARLAGLEQELGNLKQADYYYQQARSYSTEEAYLTPVQNAWLDVQHGINKFKMADYSQAEYLFKLSLTKMPNYILAMEHLAETLVLQNRQIEAIVLYEKIVRQSDDPEFIGQLARLYRLNNRVVEADILAKKALHKYQKLLSEFPQAMYWHASEFFLNEGKNPNMALILLQKNIRLRPNSASYLALAKVQWKLNLRTKAQQSINKVLAMMPTSEEICKIANTILPLGNLLLEKKCGYKTSLHISK